MGNQRSGGPGSKPRADCFEVGPGSKVTGGQNLPLVGRPGGAGLEWMNEVGQRAHHAGTGMVRKIVTAPWQDDTVATTTSAGVASARAEVKIERAWRTAARSNMPTPWVRCRVTNRASPTARRRALIRATYSPTASLISQVRGAEIAGQSFGSMQWVGQSQSANET